MDSATLSVTLQQGSAASAPQSQRLCRELYDKLKQIARQRRYAMGELSPVQTTELVHEAFLRLDGAATVKELLSQQQFLAYASRTMRNVLVDLVRERQAQRRGGGLAHTELNTAHHEVAGPGDDDELLALDIALQALQAREPRLARVVELRYFAGLEHAEIAALLDVTERTAQRDWAKARLLLRELMQAA